MKNQNNFINNNKKFSILLLFVIFILIPFSNVSEAVITSKKQTIKLPKIQQKNESVNNNNIERDFKILEQQLNLLTDEVYNDKKELNQFIKENRVNLQKISDLNSEIILLTENNNKLNRKLNIYLLIIIGLGIGLFFLLFRKISNVEENSNNNIREKSKVNNEIIEIKFEKLTRNIEKKISELNKNNNELINEEVFDKKIENIREILQNNISTITNEIDGLRSESSKNKEELQYYLDANNNFNLGNYFLKKKNFKMAIEEYLEAIRLNQNFYGAYINIGKAYEEIKELSNSEKYLLKAIEIKSENYKAYFNLGNIYIKQKKYDFAIEKFKKALNLNSNNYKIYNNLANAYQMNGKLEDAKIYYEKALSENNNYADAYVNLSKVELSLNKNNDGVYSIAEKFMKKYNATNDTYIEVKVLIKKYFGKVYHEN